jgi:hypothetical protein
MVFEKWESLLIQQKYSQIEKILTNSILANMIDMGGQPRPSFRKFPKGGQNEQV